MGVSINPFKRFSYTEQVSRSLSWGHYFIFINILLSCFLGFGYVYAAPPASNFLSFLYLIITCIGQMSFLTIVVFLVIFFPLAFIGNFRYYRVLSVLIAVIWHTILLFDIKIYLMVKVHLSMTAINLIVRELDFDTGLNYNFLFIAIPLVLGLEYAFAKITTHSLYRAHHPYLVRSILCLIGACFISSHCMHIWADAYKYERITLLRSTFPFHYPMTAKSFLSAHGWINEELLESSQGSRQEYLRYPLTPISIDEQSQGKNLIIIALNRFSVSDLKQDNTPKLLALKNAGQSFEEHYLLYNDELDNVFSLNYGLPLQYSRAMLHSNSLPVTVDEMLRQDYIRRMSVSDYKLADGATKAKLKSSNYYRRLLQNSSLRAPQLNIEPYAKDLFLSALEQIKSYNTHEERPYALTLVLNDLRAPKAINHDCAPVHEQVLAPDATLAPTGSIEAVEPAQLTDEEQSIVQRYGAWFDQAQCQISNFSEDNYLIAGDAQVRALLNYEHNVRYVDAMIGTFMEVLEDSKLLNNTIVIITSTEGNNFLVSGHQRFERLVQHVPLMVFWPDEQRKARNSEFLSSPADIFALVASDVVNITTPSGNYTLGQNLKNLGDRPYLVVDGFERMMLVSKDDTVIYSQEGDSYVERNSERMQVRPNLENLIEATRDLNRFLR